MTKHNTLHDKSPGETKIKDIRDKHQHNKGDFFFGNLTLLHHQPKHEEIKSTKIRKKTRIGYSLFSYIINIILKVLEK